MSSSILCPQVLEKAARGLLTESKTILMNYSCLALVLKSKPRLKPRRVLPFPIPLYKKSCSTYLENHVAFKSDWLNAMRLDTVYEVST